MITQAVVPAAGRGTRLGALTRDRPKALVEVGGRAMIDIVLDGLGAAGVERVVVVTGHLADRLEAHLAGRRRPRVATIRQAEPRGTGDAIRLALPLLDPVPFGYAWADVVCDPAVYRRVLEEAPRWDGVLAVDHQADVSAGALVTVASDGRVTAIEEKPPPGTEGWNQTGVGVLPVTVGEVLAGLEPSPRGELELTAAIAALVEGGARLGAVPVTGLAIDVGTPERLAAARRRFGGTGSPLPPSK